MNNINDHWNSSDSHEKQVKEEGAIRYDSMKLRWDLLPDDAIEKLVQVFTHGSAKYKDENWRKGMSFKRMYGPIFRHLTKSKRGEDLDSDSGCFHLAQVAWGAICLLWFQLHNVGEDDRIKDLNNPLYTYNGSKEDNEKQQKMFWDIIKYWTEKRKNEIKKEYRKKEDSKDKRVILFMG